MKPVALAVFAVFALSGCASYETAYEKAVYEDEPVYCYQSLGAVDCYRRPNRRDDARLVNYYGPGPARTRPSKLPPAPELQPPPAPESMHDVPSPSSAPMTQGSAKSGEGAADEETWKNWLPLISVGFGALQVLAAFVL
ncbi:MAG: hypothetical protein IPK78_12820 [Rhodospirillales bacterium]|nr:hypothetical protein [Rhodospirillales bacterium]